MTSEVIEVMALAVPRSPYDAGRFRPGPHPEEPL